MPDSAHSSEEGLQDSVAADRLRQSGQWFNLREMKRISAAVYEAFSVSWRISAHYRVEILCSLHFICQTTNPI